METLSPAGKDYLEAVLTLEQQGERVQSVDLSRLMGVTRASVSRAVGQLCEGGYLEMDGRTLRLTESGRAAAEDAREKQRFFEQMLLRAGVGGRPRAAGRPPHPTRGERGELPAPEGSAGSLKLETTAPPDTPGGAVLL